MIRATSLGSSTISARTSARSINPRRIAFGRGSAHTVSASAGSHPSSSIRQRVSVGGNTPGSIIGAGQSREVLGRVVLSGDLLYRRSQVAAVLQNEAPDRYAHKEADGLPECGIGHRSIQR